MRRMLGDQTEHIRSPNQDLLHTTYKASKLQFGANHKLRSNSLFCLYCYISTYVPEKWEKPRDALLLEQNDLEASLSRT